MIKTVLILSSLFAGITSFAGQSRISQAAKSSRIPVSCTITIRTSNMQIRTTAANCKTMLTAAQVQHQLINFDTPSFEGSGTFFESNLPYLQP